MRRAVALLVVLMAVLAGGCEAQRGTVAVERTTPRTAAPPGSTASPGTPTAPPRPAPSRAAAPRTVSIVMGGDLLWHNTVWASAAADHARTGAGDTYDFDPMFAWLRPVVAAADVAICQEEVPFAAPGEPLRSYPVFAAPPQIAPWIASMGWDACTTASNHSLDGGTSGIDETADLLEDAGVAHVGTFRSLDERRRPVILTTDQGVRVGIVAATYGLNGFVLPAGHEYAVSQLDDADDLLGQAHRARQAGADVVVAHVHWGIEYDHRPDPAQVALARRLAASPDIDLVLGDHAHVVQPITRINGTWVVYGLGNMVAQGETDRPDTYEGITVTFDFTERPDGTWRVSRASYLPTQWNHFSAGHPIRITRATGRHLASVRAAVHAVGGTRGLQEG